MVGINLTPKKSDELAKLKVKLTQAKAKLKEDPHNKRLQEVVNNLESMFKREHERGFC